jgi:hypothetical protein
VLEGVLGRLPDLPGRILDGGSDSLLPHASSVISTPSGVSASRSGRSTSVVVLDAQSRREGPPKRAFLGVRSCVEAVTP